MRAAIALCVGAASLIGASSARADGLVFNEGKMLPARSDTRTDASLNYVISKKDCTENIEFPFSITIAKPEANQTLEIWFAEGSTADCSAYTARYGTTAFCKLVHSDAVPTNSNGAYLYTPKAAELAALHSAVTDCDVDEATPLPITLTFLQLKNGEPMATAAGSATWGKTSLRLRAPDPPDIADGVSTGEGTIKLPFTALDPTTLSYAQEMLLFCDPPPASATSAGCGCINSGLTSTTTTTTSSTSSTTSSTTTDTTVPSPPTGGTGGIGGMTAGTGGMTGGIGGMTAGTGGMTGGTGGMTASTGGTGGMTGGTGGTGGMTGGTGGMTAGAGGSTGGSSGGSTGGTAGSGGVCTITDHTVEDCRSCYLTEGQLGLSKDSKYYCGTASVSATEITSVTLDNGRGYAVGMAILDKVGNVGALSALRCGTPSEVTDFYESYHGRGGTAGGGLCAMRPGMRDPNYLAPAGIGVALALLGGRRAARRRKGPIDVTKRGQTPKDEADR